MSVARQRRRGTTANHASFTGLAGEVTVDTDKDVVVVHDGSTAGGFPHVRGSVGSTDNRVVRSDGTGTATVQGSAVTIDDSGNVSANGLALTVDLPVTEGGTGASDAAGARTNLGLVIGTDVQAYDAELAAIASLTSAANKAPYFTGSGTAALADLSSAGRSMIGAANAADQTALLSTMVGDSGAGGTKGLVPAPAAGDAAAGKYLDADGTWTVPPGGGGGGGDALTTDPLSQFAATTSAELRGVISDETGTGALVFATSPTLVTPALGTPSSGTLTNCTGLPASGVSGTALVSAAIGTTVQAYDAELAAIAGLTSAADKGIQFTGSGAAATFDLTTAGKALLDDADASAQRTTLGFGANLLQMFVEFHARGDASMTLTDVAAGDAFLGKSNSNIRRADLTDFTQVRFHCRVTGAATAGTLIKLRYYTSFSTTIGDYVDVGTSAVQVDLAATGHSTSSWINLAVGAKADVYLAPVQTGGDGATDPAIRWLAAEFRRQ